MQRQEKSIVIRKWQRIAASIWLFALLIQILLFFVGLMDPVRRAASLWGKSRDERLTVVWQPGSVFTSIAKQFPMNARIFLMHPNAMLQYNSVYYFYPRIVTITLTNGLYCSDEEFKAWDEQPTDALLFSNHITYVLTLEHGGRAWQVRGGVQQEIAEWESAHASK